MHKRTFVQGLGKPPKLRFKPGTFVVYEGQFYEIMYAYRVAETPHEWYFALEERKVPSSAPIDEIGKYLKIMGFGSTIPRVVYDVFRDFEEVYDYFVNIPLNGNRKDVPNKSMIQGARIINA